MRLGSNARRDSRHTMLTTTNYEPSVWSAGCYRDVLQAARMEGLRPQRGARIARHL